MQYLRGMNTDWCASQAQVDARLLNYFDIILIYTNMKKGQMAGRKYKKVVNLITSYSIKNVGTLVVNLLVRCIITVLSTYYGHAN